MSRTKPARCLSTKMAATPLLGIACLATMAEPAVSVPQAAVPGTAVGILLIAGDIAKCNPRSGRDEATADLIAAEIARADAAKLPVRVLALGDLAYDNGTATEFNCFDASWGRFKDRILPVPGNHEYQTDRGAPYFAYFAGNPLVTQNGPAAGYYSLDFPAAGGAWHIVALNAYAGIGAGSRQLNWLRQDLSATSAPCVIAFSHPFRFSSGHWGHERSPQRKAPVRPLPLMADAYAALVQGSASLFVAGHDHDFEQFGPQDVAGHGGSGPRSFVVGTGGGPLYNSVAYSTRAANSEAFQARSHGVLKIVLHAHSYEWDFLPIAGAADVTLSPARSTCAR